MNARKITTACFIGGAIGTAIALCITPITLWKVLLGTLTGFAAGYTSYEFKEVWRNIPLAWETSTRGLSIGWENTIKWLKKPHPALYPLIGIFAILLYIMMPPTMKITENITAKIATLTVLLIAIGVVSLIIFLLLIALPMEKGELLLQCIIERDYSEKTEEKKKKDGYRILPITYRNVYRLVWAGYVVEWAKCVKVFKKIPTSLKAFAKFLLKAICFLIYGWEIPLVKFIWTLIQLVHSHERIWCGIHSAIGVVTACAIETMTNSQLILSILIGGVIGTTWGTLSYKIIKKFPKLSTA
jgi:hypothetical protein